MEDLDKCPKCESQRISTTLMGWFNGGPDPNIKMSNLDCYGMSESIGITSRGDIDKKIIETYYYGGFIG